MVSCCRKSAKVEEPIFKTAAERKCTDVPCCILFLVFWVGMIIIAAVGFVKGTPERLFYGTDYEGVTCGTDANVNEKLVYYPRITEDLIAFAASGETDITKISLFGICFSECPQSGEIVCTEEGDVALAARTGTSESAKYEVCSTDYPDLLLPDCQTVQSNCWTVPLATTEVFHRCLWERNKTELVTSVCTSPAGLSGRTMSQLTATQQEQCVTMKTVTTTTTNGEAQPNPVLNQLLDTAAVFSRLIGDLINALPAIIIAGFAVALVMGFVWILLVKWFIKPMVWITLIGSVVALLIATIVAYVKAGLITQDALNAASSTLSKQAGTTVSAEMPAQLTALADDTQDKDRWAVIAYCLTAFTLVLFFIVITMRQKIRIAVEVIREASKALGALWQLALTPFLTIVSVLVLIIYWIFVAVHIYSMKNGVTLGDVTSVASSIAMRIPTVTNTLTCHQYTDTVTHTVETQCTTQLVPKAYADNEVGQYLLIYHFFGLLWTNQFLQAIATLIIAGGISEWYFSRDKKKLRKGIIRDSCWRTFRFHLGSIAFGSLLIAIVQFLRAVMAYIDRQTKTLQGKNVAIKIVMSCVQACLWCFEKCVKFLTQYAFIFVAMKGSSFISSAKATLELILSQFAQIAIIETVVTIIFMVGKIMISTISALVAYAILTKSTVYQDGGERALEDPMLPVLVSTLLAFAVATAFLGTYSLTIDTVLVCYCEDKKANDGSLAKPYFMSDELVKVMGGFSQKASSSSSGSSEMELTPVAPAGGASKGTGGEGEAKNESK